MLIHPTSPRVVSESMQNFLFSAENPFFDFFFFLVDFSKGQWTLSM